MDSLGRRWALVADVAKALWMAWLARAGRNSARLRMPEAGARTLGDDELGRLLRGMDRFSGLLGALSRHKCYYRSCILCYVLRRRGVPAELNAGASHDGASWRSKGHMWLSIEGRPLAEAADPRSRYQVCMGPGCDGINYWVGSPDDADGRAAG